MQNEEFERAVRATVQTFRASHPEQEFDVMVEYDLELIPVTAVKIQFSGDTPVLVISTNPVDVDPAQVTSEIPLEDVP